MASGGAPSDDFELNLLPAELQRFSVRGNVDINQTSLYALAGIHHRVSPRISSSPQVYHRAKRQYARVCGNHSRTGIDARRGAALPQADDGDAPVPEVLRPDIRVEDQAHAGRPMIPRPVPFSPLSPR